MKAPRKRASTKYILPRFELLQWSRGEGTAETIFAMFGSRRVDALQWSRGEGTAET